MSRRTRRPAHIAMVGTPAVSHVIPSLEIIRELASRGHRVTYANDPRVAGLVAGTGAEPVRFASTLPVDDYSWPEDPVAAMGLFLDDAIATLPAVRRAYRDDRPDVLLYDIAGYSARVLAETWGIPAVQLSPTYVAWKGYEEEAGARVRALPGAGAYFARFDAWLTEQGVPLGAEEFAGRPRRVLALIPRAMQPFADTVDPWVADFVGPCFGDRSEQGEWRPPPGAEGKKVLLVSMGTSFTDLPGFYRACLRAFGGLPDWHVVLQVGRAVDLGALGPVPDNTEVHRWVPQLAILKQASAFVTHAGMGGSSEGLYCGVPMIAVPQFADQFANADALQDQGVARRIDTGEATAERLRAALEELTSSPRVAARLAEIGAELRGRGGAGYAADLIEAEIREE
ncbi:macrolide family glycosyltransferase [Nocardiopsis composta]|uniref:MGT family glycosyltransferase n=1 Tax=Nocardiopsis composta TaxID=157465 RepID=A0A7W8QID7_9ACTN|nr:macrolide family glycosyltransferase [Nocardiopsis composta]MBB5430529.1 MGT family glycosyltransferase [Nocardiopsis composta]